MKVGSPAGPSLRPTLRRLTAAADHRRSSRPYVHSDSLIALSGQILHCQLHNILDSVVGYQYTPKSSQPIDQHMSAAILRFDHDPSLEAIWKTPMYDSRTAPQRSS